jgi:hypothetical protein
MKWIDIGVILVVMFIAWAGPSASLAAQRVEVPIEQIVLSDGEIRYFIRVSVGASSVVNAMLDTGSSGLRLLRGAIPDSAYAITGQPSSYNYDSGVRLVAHRAELPMSTGIPPPMRLPEKLSGV